MSDKIKPIPQPESDRYWEGANEKKLLIQKFGEHIQFYPRAVSTKDGSRDVEWIEASGKAKLYTFTIVHQAPHPSFVDDLPYVAAIVTLEEGINMPTRIKGVDPEPENFTIGMDLVVDFIDADGQNLPVFRPA